MAKAEGKTLDFVGEEAIDVKVLETFPYEGPRQKVIYETREFSAVCPFSGLPDIGHLCITYIPSNKIVELKSLKYYFLSYRNVGIYQEHAAARIYKDLMALLSPQFLEIRLVYNTRGGIDTTSIISSQE